MKAQIDEVIASGYKPVIYISSDLEKHTDSTGEIRRLVVLARHNNVPVYRENSDLTPRHKLRKVHVFRYGMIPMVTEAFIKRKGGVIVSGNLYIPE